MIEPLRDPAGLLERAPELAALANADGSVRRALERGNPHGVYRALWWARRLGRLSEHGPTLDSLLAHRRLFAAPLRRSPVLTTFNGVGAAVYGSSAADPDGTYLKTHFLVLVFVPVFPLSQYLVKNAPDGSNSWYFLAKVPMSTPLQLWNRLVVAGLLAGLAFGGWRTFHASRHHDVHVVNGLPVPVRVRIGSVASDVPAGQYRTSSVPTGTHAVEVTDAGGKAVEAGEMKVDAGPHLLAWNVLGAAPLFERTVLYGNAGAISAKDEATSQPRYLCGQRAVRVNSVDFAFREPPQSVSLPQGQTVGRRSHVGVGPGKLAVCASMIAATGKPEPAVALAEGLAAFDQDPETVAVASFLYRAAGQLDQAVALTRESRTRHADSIEHHRLYQTLVEEQGKVAELREEYRLRYASAPDSAAAGYLYARVLPNPEAFALGTSLLQRFPAHVPLHRLAISGSVRRFAFPEALGYLERMRTLDPKEWMRFAEDHVTVLAGLGRPADARKVAQEAFAAAEDGGKVRLAGLDSWLGGAPAPGAALFQRLGSFSPIENLRFRLRFWTTAAGEDLRSLAGDPQEATYRLMQDAHFNPRAAVDDASRLEPGELSELDNEVLLLLLGEALQAGHAGARERLEAAATSSRMSVPAIKAYLAGGAWSDEVDRLNLREHGALHLARSRGRELNAAERARLRDLARRCDPLGGYVTRALEMWPAS